MLSKYFDISLSKRYVYLFLASHNSDLRDSHEYNRKKCDVGRFLDGREAGGFERTSYISLSALIPLTLHI